MLNSETELSFSDHYESLPDQINSSSRSSMDKISSHERGTNSRKGSGYMKLDPRYDPELTTEVVDDQYPHHHRHHHHNSHSHSHHQKKSSKKRSPSSKRCKYKLLSMSQTAHSKTMSWISESSLETDIDRSTQVYSPVSCCSSPYRSNYDISCTSLHYQETRDVLLSKNAFDKYGIKINRIAESFFIALIVMDSPASRAGLKVGDEIIRINEQTVENFSNRRLLQLIKESNNELKISFKPRLVIARLRLVILRKIDGKFGVRVQRRSEGIFVTVVLPESAAARAGISEGDELLKVNEDSVSHWSQEAVTQRLREANTDEAELLLFMRQIRPVEDFRILSHMHNCRQHCIGLDPPRPPSAMSHYNQQHYQQQHYSHYTPTLDSTRLSPYNF